MNDNQYTVPGRELDRLLAERDVLRGRVETLEAERNDLEDELQGEAALQEYVEQLRGRVETLTRERDDAIRGRDDLPMAHELLAQLKAAEGRVEALTEAGHLFADQLTALWHNDELREKLAARDLSEFMGLTVEQYANFAVTGDLAVVVPVEKQPRD